MTAMPICSMLWMLLCLVWLALSLSRKETQEKAHWGERLAYGLPVVIAFYLLFSDRIPFAWLRFRIIPPSFLTDALGVALTGVGIAFAIWARFYIGNNWSSAPSIKVGHELVRTGPYAWVRHPIYSGLLIATAGTALVRGELRGIVVLLVLWLAFSLKSRIEERLMMKTFGSVYDEYSRSTGALIPRLHGRKATI
jgi:protein-S-isoprenylcysteine O-methyltransferase Ste14